MTEFQTFETDPIIVGPIRRRELKNPVNQTALRNKDKVVTADAKSMERMATAEDIEYAAAFMEQSFSIQSERIQVIVDAALLAAEQVQDKRIEAQEKGKRVTIDDVIFDLLTVYLWEVGIIGHVLSPLVMHTTEVIWKKSLSMEAVYDRLEKSDYGSELIGYARREEKDGASVIKDIIKNHVRNEESYGSEDYALFSKETREMISKASENAVTKVSGEIKKWKELKDKVNDSSLDKTDSPGVALLKAAQSYGSRNRVALNAQRAKLIALVRSSNGLTRQQLDDFLMLFAWEELPEDRFLRVQYQLAMEIVIWCRLYGFEPGSTKPEVHVNAGKFADIDERISDYWLERLGDIMIEYVKPAKWETDYTKGAKLLQIKKYFEEVLQSMNKKTDKIRPIDQAFIVHPE